MHALLRSWLPESGGEVKVFEGGSRSITLMYLKGNVCESDNMQFCDKVYLDLKPECPELTERFFLPADSILCFT